MKLALMLLLCWPFIVRGQINQPLKRELDSMYVLDQQYREYLSEIGQNACLKDSLAAAYQTNANQVLNVLLRKMATVDSSNIGRVAGILKRYGYPGKTLVGEPTNEAAWYVVQHSDKINTYLPVVRKAGATGELPFRLVAMMEDRQLMYAKQPQIYGTQGSCMPLKTTGESECFIWPIEQPEGVNERRKQAGFKETVEEYAKDMDMTYRPLTMAQVKARYVLPK